MSNSLRPQESQHIRPPCPSPTPRVHPNSCAPSRWCHPAISSFVIPFSSCSQFLPASGSFPMQVWPKSNPYSYTVEMRNRFKGLDLIDRVPEELWMEICDIVQGQWSRPSPRKRNAKKKNSCLRRQVLQIAVKKKIEKPNAKEKRKDIPIWMQSSKE